MAAMTGYLSMGLAASRKVMFVMVGAAQLCAVMACSHASGFRPASKGDFAASCSSDAGSVTPLSEPLLLRFSPFAERPIEERSITVRSERARGAPRAGVEEVEARLSSTFAPEPDGAWRLQQNITSVQVRIDGAPVENRLTQLVTRFALEVALSSEGSFVRLQNPRAASEAVGQLFTRPEEAEAARGFFAPEAMEEGARKEWEGRFGQLFGERLTTGRALYSIERFTTASGQEQAYILVRTVQGWVETPFGRALQLGLHCLGRTDGEGGEAAREAVRGAALPPGGLNSSVRCDGRQRLFLTPFLPLELRLAVTAQLKAPDGSVRELEFKRESTWVDPRGVNQSPERCP
jgi:hypothetical protein